MDEKEPKLTGLTPHSCLSPYLARFSMLRYLLILLGLFSFLTSFAQKRPVQPLAGKWQLRYMEINGEPIWSSYDSSTLFRFAEREIGRTDLAVEDSLVLIEKIKGLDPNFRKMRIIFADSGKYEFVLADPEDPFREPVTEKGRYQLFRKEQSVILSPDPGIPQTLRYELDDGRLKLYGTDEQEGYMLFDRQ